MAKYLVDETSLRDVADDIRAKTGGSSPITFPAGFKAAIETLVSPSGNQDIATLDEYNVSAKATARVSAAERAKFLPENIADGVTLLGVQGTHQGGTDTSDATAYSSDILFGATAYARGEKLFGSILSKQAAQYTPSTQLQVISAGQYLAGDQYIAGDVNLVAENIKKDVTIFGVTGTMELQTLQSFDSFAVVTESGWIASNTDFKFSGKNGYWGNIVQNIELYRDDVLIHTILDYTLFKSQRRYFGGEEVGAVNLGELGLAIRGAHNYKIRMISNGYLPSDFKYISNYTMYAKPPQLTLTANLLTLSNTDPNTDQFKIYVDNVLKTTITKTGDSTILDLTTLSLSDGSHEIKAKSIGQNVNDSRVYSNSVTYVASSGYNISTDLTVEVSSMMLLYIKLNTAPVSEDDYDYYYYGEVGSYDTDIPASFLASKVYIWGEDGEVTSPVSASMYPSHRTYDTALEIVFNSASTLALTLYMDE